MGALDGRVALVTGASRGIGVAIARRLANDGAAVAVSARTVERASGRFAGSLDETVEAIRRAGGTAVSIAADLSTHADRVELVDQATKELGPIDILVNNAAVTWFEPLAEFNEHHYDVMFEVQVKAPFHLAQLVLPGMKDRGRGWILNISSGAARHPQGPPSTYRRAGGGSVYGMCKAALERFTTGLAAELWDEGIAVNVLSPSGPVATPGIIHHRLVPPGSEDRYEPIELMAEAALALCSGDPRQLTGRMAYSRPLLVELGREAQPLR
ncbi:MAG TPA: SDR family NAD(P)-dependent oxidoreductase [Acidimicrobiales bacterium]|nr:SDR family NAD(P)-dependent oxidoreductase [Acidimicrobiales bacterium]